MARYGKKAQRKVKRAMHKRKHGTLRSGRSGKRVKSRKQAIAIGLSEARRAGGKVPKRRRKSSRRTK
jgi:predicted SPOUT superfamily RNA methylase MTH1